MATEVETAEPTQQSAEITTANDDIFEGGEVEEQSATVGEEPGASAEAEGSETQTVGEVEGEEQAAEDTEWLPTEQDKVFKDEVYVRYAKRYGYTQEDLADPRIQRLLHDKINSDIFLKQQQAATAEEPTEEEEEAEQQAEPTREPTPQERTEAVKQHFQKIDGFVDTITDPEIATQFHDDFMRTAGVPEQTIKGTKPEAKIAFVKTLSRGAINLLMPVIDSYLFGAPGPDQASNFEQRLGKALDSRYEGFNDYWKSTAEQRVWEQARGKYPNAKLPAYDTAQGSPWSTAIAKLAEMYPGFEDARFVDPKTGKLLSSHQNFVRKTELAVKLLSGQTVNPQVVQTAVEKGKQIERQAARTKQNGQLGAGQSTRGTKAPGLTSNDDLFGPGEEKWQQEHGRLPSSRK